jgi:hypothetical protein
VSLVSREELRNVLAKWQRGELGHSQVYDWSNEHFGLDQMDGGDLVVNEILAHLDIMDVNLITPDDVPVFLAMLDAVSEADATELLRRHGDALDLDERIARWGTDPFYAPFCHRVGEPPPHG